MTMASSMSSQFSTLSALARSKLHLSVSSKDNYSLHRCVLLKNSINRSKNSLLTEADVSSSSAAAVVSDGHRHHHQHVVVVDEGDEDEEDEEADSFMFPDAGELGDGKGADSNASEAEWLDSLLETLGEDDDDDFNVDSDVHSPHDDEDQILLSPLISPLVSPTSSSDDLVNQAYDPPPIIAVPYPVPYPPFHPPLVRSYQLDPIYSPHDSSSLPYDNPLPYHDIDDVEDLSVPDAIEDTSDDESDATTTPSLIQSSSRSSLVDPNSPVYIEQSYCYPFELDPLPFSGHLDSYNHVYHEC